MSGGLDGGPVPAGARRRTATLDGLRGVAVLAVVAEHTWAPILPGGFAGVDVFFVLSGYLITGLLASELFAGGRIDLAGFYSRRVRRIVPAALVTVLGVSVLYAVLLGPAVPDTLPTEAASAAFSYSNILFASRATDYFAADAAQSPFLHFWSLAVEEQFYLVWPSLLLLLAFAERRIPVAALRRWWVPAVLVAGAALSLWLAIHSPQARAFYLLPQRAWELIAGGVLVWLQRDPRIRLPSIPKPVQAAGVVAGALAVAFVFVRAPELGRWPGPGTVVVVGGVLLLVAPGDRMPAAWMLANRPLVFFGRISYALYLWHWPLLAAARLVALPAVEPPPWLLLGAVILAIVIATASTLFMEEPIRSSTWATFRGRRAVGLALGSMAVVAVTSAALITWTPGAMTARGSLEDALVAARHDRSRLLDDGCFSATTAKAKLKDCIYGAGARPDGSPGHGQPEQPVVVLVGDSHAMSWFAAIDDWASNRGLALVPLTRSGCRAGLSDPAESRDSAKCTAWRDLAVERIAELRPLLTIVASSRWPRFQPLPWADEATDFLEAVSAGSRSTILIGDTPRAPFLIPDCLAVHRFDPGTCAMTAADATSADVARAEREAADSAGVAYVDATNWLCPDNVCTWITDGRVGWFDDHHLTAAGSRSALPGLARAFDSAAATAGP